jgi:hypothetical protein
MSEGKPLSAVLAVPTRGFIWHETATQISHLRPTYYREKLSVASVRNKIVHDFLNDKLGGGGQDLLFMCDDDVIPPHQQWAEVMAAGPFDVVGAPVPMSKLPDLPVILNCFTRNEDGNWITAQHRFSEKGYDEVDAVGTGLIMIRREVLEHPDMVRPFEQTLTDEGTIKVGQDINFCIRAKKAGFTIGISNELICDHFAQVHLNTIPYVYGKPDYAPQEVTEE